MKRVVTATVCLALAGCFFPAERGARLEGRVDALADENQRLKTELEDTRVRLAEATAQLKTALDQLDNASRTTGANIGVRVDSAIQDVATLRGQVEGYQHKVGEIEQKVATLEDRTTALATATPPAPPEPRKEELKRPDEPKAFLTLADDKAKTDVELGRRLYNEFIKRWPRDEQAGEAHYRLGQTYFTEKKCREALYEFGKVIQDHPKTRSAPSAYLNSSDCFGELKMSDAAKTALEELIKQHPRSDAAKSAKTKLAALTKAPAPAKKKGSK